MVPDVAPVSTALPVGSPAARISSRPKPALHQASAQVGVATAAMFPSISLTGDYGAPPAFRWPAWPHPTGSLLEHRAHRRRADLSGGQLSVRPQGGAGRLFCKAARSSPDRAGRPGSCRPTPRRSTPTPRSRREPGRLRGGRAQRRVAGGANRQAGVIADLDAMTAQAIDASAHPSGLIAARRPTAAGRDGALPWSAAAAGRPDPGVATLSAYVREMSGGLQISPIAVSTPIRVCSDRAQAAGNDRTKFYALVIDITFAVFLMVR